MLSVLMDCGADDQKLAASLATLIPGAVEGVVREVVLIDRGMDVSARKVADHAGCRVAEPGDLHSVVAQAKGDWLLLLEPGARLQPGWIPAVAEHVEEVAGGRAGASAVRFARARADRPGLLGRFSQKRTALAEGVLLRKAQALGQAKGAGSLEGVARGLAVGRLPAEIRPAQRRRK
ncbi:glycosyl transferase family 2 [Jiella sp. M17.18]|uniref:glycosyl transferase family 2 n=1 Tax=Jiella sp. M17.18 TaxID=3234247 RepID=UPI0034DF3AD7